MRYWMLRLLARITGALDAYVRHHYIAADEARACADALPIGTRVRLHVRAGGGFTSNNIGTWIVERYDYDLDDYKLVRDNGDKTHSGMPAFTYAGKYAMDIVAQGATVSSMS